MFFFFFSPHFLGVFPYAPDISTSPRFLYEPEPEESTFGGRGGAESEATGVKESVFLKRKSQFVSKAKEPFFLWKCLESF